MQKMSKYQSSCSHVFLILAVFALLLTAGMLYSGPPASYLAGGTGFVFLASIVSAVLIRRGVGCAPR